MRAETMLFVHDVEATSKWYQDFLGVRSGHGGPEYEMLMDGETLLLQLHHLDDEDDHDHGVDTAGPFGNGVLVYIHVPDIDAAFARAKELALDILMDLHHNDKGYMHEFTVRDPNGYAIGVCKSDWA